MTPSKTRRELLTAGGTASISVLTGCAGVLDSRELAHEVEVYNREKIARTLSVTVTNDGGDELYQREFTLEGERAEEDTEPFTGSPTTITVAVDNGSPSERSWPETNCEDRGKKSAGGIGVYLTAESGVQIEPTCATVYAE